MRFISLRSAFSTSTLFVLHGSVFPAKQPDPNKKTKRNRKYSAFFDHIKYSGLDNISAEIILTVRGPCRMHVHTILPADRDRIQSMLTKESNMRKPSGLGVREIARKLNLNISTVSRALNHSYHVSKETTELVLRTANEMGYHKQYTRKCIVVLLPASEATLAWYTVNLINALQKSLLSRDYYWEFIPNDRIEIIQERSVSGIISIDYRGQIAREIGEKYNIPLVCINDAPNHVDEVYSVNSDAASAIALAFGCLHDYGHRHIAYISTSGESVAGTQRKKAFLDMVSHRGLSDSCIFMDKNVQSYHGTIRELYLNGITAIIAEGESAGLSIYNSLIYCKLPIPEKMSLITWELPYVSSMIHPSLTTVEQNFTELAEKAVLVLDSLIRKESVTGDVIIPYKLHERNSVSIPRE